MSEALAVATSDALPWVSARRTAAARVHDDTEIPMPATAQRSNTRCALPVFIVAPHPLSHLGPARARVRNRDQDPYPRRATSDCARKAEASARAANWRRSSAAPC